MAVVLHRHFERQLADFLHAIGFFGQDAAADIALFARGQLRGDGLFVEIGKDRLEFGGDGFGIAHQRPARALLPQRLGIEPQRISGKSARERHAVAVGDLPARREQGLFERSTAHAVIRHAEIADPHQRHQRHEGKAQRDP